MLQDLGGAWADILGCAGVLAGVAAFCGLIVFNDRRRPGRVLQPTDTALRLDRRREWETVLGHATRDLARAPRLEELHTGATVKIEAAEHALNRLMLDHAGLCKVPAAGVAEPEVVAKPAPALQPAPAPDPAPAPEAPAETQPLAA
jgi:hypothetical protein